MPFFKNYNKDVKDLLTQNYTAGWKLESKFKGDDKKVFVNPQFDSKAGFNVDVECGVKDFGVKAKVNVNTDLAVAPKLTYDKDGQKVEASYGAAGIDVVYEGKFGDLMLNDKYSGAGIEAGFSYGFGTALGLSIGAGAVLGANFALKSWSGGFAFTCPLTGSAVNITTTGLKTFSAGCLKGLKVADNDVKVAAQFDYGTAFAATVGAEFGCSLCPNTTWRFKVSDKLAISAAYIKKLTDNFKVAVSYDVNTKKIGVAITRE